MSAMRRTIRFRITAIATTLSAVLLTAISLLMVVVLQAQLTDNLDEGLRQRSDTIAAVLADAVPAELAGDEDLLVQVVMPDGEIVAASTNLAGTEPIAPLQPGIRRSGDVPGRTEEFRVLTRAVDTAQGPAFAHRRDQLR